MARTVAAFLFASFLALSGAVSAASGPQLSAAERAQRLKALPADDRQWLEEYVAPIILPEEAQLFLQLTEPHQREIFRNEFWARREREGLAPPLGPGYRSRYDHFREVAAAEYDGLTHDAGKLVVHQGEPDSIQRFADCGEVFRSVEIWNYTRESGGIASRPRFIFYRPSPGAPRKIWYPAIPEREVMVASACFKGFAEACQRAATGGSGASCANPQSASGCAGACAVAEAAAQIQARGLGAVEAAALDAPLPVDTEDLAKLADRFASLGDAQARPLSVEGPADAAAAPAASASAAAPTSPSAKVASGPAAAASAPAPARRKLSKKEARALTEALPQKYKDFLNLVELIVTDDEREVFLQIHEDYQKDKFIEAFWKRRSIDAQGLRTDYRATYTRRVEQAVEQFHDLHNDRAKMFVINGPPDAVIPIECEDVYVPLQIWYYDRIEALKSKVYLIFYRPGSIGPYKLWLPLDGQGVLLVGVGSQGQIAAARVPDIQRCFEWRTV
ncbi:MAG: GWxTD domain-containing protein, partial [Acidobacteriota bacterium]